MQAQGDKFGFPLALSVVRGIAILINRHPSKFNFLEK